MAGRGVSGRRGRDICNTSNDEDTFFQKTVSDTKIQMGRVGMEREGMVSPAVLQRASTLCKDSLTLGAHSTDVNCSVAL